jgi:hypothetical protein
MVAKPETIKVCILSSTSYGHVEQGYMSGAWAVPRTTVGGLELRAERLVPGTPSLFYVSRSGVWGDGFFCGPGLITAQPSDAFAKQHSHLFPEGNDWCLGFPIRRLAAGVACRMSADQIRRLTSVGGGNYSQTLHLAGRCVFLPCDLTLDDCRAILAATGAADDAIEVWAGWH